ncbi:MAG TPA: hypothetical protein VEU30_00300 [Thermoanaerobaculia bacterium]|nr:hypothetical protein [Thermoanaerobaculia bacterium]
MTSRIEAAIERATRYLGRSQSQTGCWTDYHLPVGASDGWVTAYAGWSLSRVAHWTRNGRAEDASEAAADWLAKERPYDAGWGYNGVTGPDADSTGLALALLDDRKRGVRDEDRQFLASMWHDEGGFATYAGRGDAWSRPRVDVVFPAFLGLPRRCRDAWASAAIDHVLAARATDGLWWGYWWAGPWYPTWTALALLRSLGSPVPSFDPKTEWPQPRTALETAFLAAVLHSWGVPSLRDHLIDLLIQRQDADGQWDGGFDLRVTNPDCDAPWERNDSGVLYRDMTSTITTASVMRILAEVNL